MTIELSEALAKSYAMKMSGKSPDTWLKKEIADSAALKQEVVAEIVRMEAVIKRRGAEACHLTSVQCALLKAALKE